MNKISTPALIFFSLCLIITGCKKENEPVVEPEIPMTDTTPVYIVKVETEKDVLPIKDLYYIKKREPVTLLKFGYDNYKVDPYVGTMTFITNEIYTPNDILFILERGGKNVKYDMSFWYQYDGNKTYVLKHHFESEGE